MVPKDDDIPFEFDDTTGDVGLTRPLVEEIDNRIRNDSWRRRYKQRRCVRKVASRTLSEPTDEPIADRRKRAQEQVAAELDVQISTVNDHCGRQLFDEHHHDPRSQWIQRFDAVLKEIEDDRTDGLNSPDHG